MISLSNDPGDSMGPRVALNFKQRGVDGNIHNTSIVLSDRSSLWERGYRANI